MQQIINSDCLLAMKEMEDNSIDFIVTDPPYGLKFMGKQWDHGIPGIEFWAEMLRICKPGSMLAAFGGTRTFHRLTCSIEDAGWRIMDCMMFLYGTGFPKAMNFGKKLSGKWEGYSSCGLKPAYEPIILAMKPLDGTYAQNAEKWGVAGINIDESRIGTEERTNNPAANQDREKWRMNQGAEAKLCNGRWPANLILDEDAAHQLDQQTGNNVSRFFYSAKSSSAERNLGLEGMPLKEGGSNAKGYTKDIKNGIDRNKPVANFHPTVKPLALMRYIIKLLSPPGDPLLLDPFMGSGSTLCAAKQLGIRAIGIELDSEYCEISRRRIEGTKQEEKQMELFDNL